MLRSAHACKVFRNYTRYLGVWGLREHGGPGLAGHGRAEVVGIHLGGGSML